MKSDGTIWIDTKIDENGMEEGFRRLQDGADDVAVTVKKLEHTIEDAYAAAGNSKAVSTAAKKLEDLKNAFSSVDLAYQKERKKLDQMQAEYDAIQHRMDPDVYEKSNIKYGRVSEFGPDTWVEDLERMEALTGEIEKQSEAVKDLESKWKKAFTSMEDSAERLSGVVANECEKQAAAEERAAQRAIDAAEKEADAKAQATSRQFNTMGNSAGYFGTRLRGIVTSAFIFNILSSGLRKVTSYFGSALMANNEFATAVYRLQGSLMVAFQPIYETVLPALITLINWLNVAVQAVARFFTILAGKSYKQVQQNAEALNNVAGSAGNTAGSVEDAGDAIQDTGKKAKEAEKYLAGFDEINRILRTDTDDLSDSLDDLNSGSLSMDEFKGPIFDEVELPTEWETAIDKLAMRFKDIFFEWEDLNAEIVTEKLLTALTALAGAYIGFQLGGPGGALIGLIVGAGLGVVLSSLIFDGDGNLSAEELLKTLVAALSVIAGVLIAFSVGGKIGAAIGVAVGAGLTMVLLSWIFDEDGQLSESELAKTLVLVLGAVCSFIAFTALGGAAGALLGAAFGVSLSMVITNFLFDGDGQLSENEMISALVATLAIIGAGIVLFSGGGVIGAAIGATVGISLGLTLTSLVFNNDGELDSQELLTSLCLVLGTIFGGLIGFWVGSHLGPIGAVAGAALGAAVGLALSFSLMDVEFGQVENEYDNLNKKVGSWSDETTQTTEDRYIKPTATNFQNLQKEMTTEIAQTKENIINSMDDASDGAEITFFEPMTKMSAQLAESMYADNKNAAEKIANSWQDAQNQVERNYIEPTKAQFTEVTQEITDGFENARSEIQETWREMPGFFQNEITGPMLSYFDTLTSGIIERFNQVAQSVSESIRQMNEAFNNIMATYNSGVQKMNSTYESAKRQTSSSSAASYAATAQAAYPTMYYPTAEIPMLARGAVIPPNRKFLAVLGDQRSGTNVEAPLATIQEAVALVMEDVIQSNLAGHEATVELLRQILEAILGIELDGETLSRAIGSYDRKMAEARGGLT